MTIHVQAGDIRNLAETTKQGSEQIKDLMRVLSTAYGSSDSYWQGNARTQFVQAQHDWNIACGQMRQALFDNQQLMVQWTAKMEELDNSVTTGGGGGGGGGQPSQMV